MSFALVLIVSCVYLPFLGVQGSAAGICTEWEHHTYGKGVTCCHHKQLISGINEMTHWQECINHPKDEKEDYVTSMWRVYTCVLEKSLPKGQKTISLTKFSEIMTSKYPDDIKKQINNEIKKIGKDEGKTKTWLTADVKLTDQQNIDKLRADYFNVEKKICGGLKGVPKGEEKGKPWTSCNMDEEIIHRDADCCGPTTLPFVDHHHNHYQDFNNKNCAETLKKKLDILKLKDKEDKASFLDECQFSCYLIEKKLITIDQLLKIRVKDVIETEKIVMDYLPPYLSQAVQKQMQTHVKTHFNRTAVMDMVPETMLGDKADKDELYGCYAYAEINELASHALFQICHPNFSNDDPDYK